MLGTYPIGARPLGAPGIVFVVSITGQAPLPGLLAGGTIARTRLIESVGALPGLKASGVIAHPHAWNPVPPIGEIWSDVPSSGNIWTPVKKTPGAWS